MAGKKYNITLASYEDIFLNDEGRAEKLKEKVENISLFQLLPFENHPFQVLHNEELEKLVESIKENGVLYPAIARPKGDNYELISGHRRKIACEILGLETMPVFIRDMDDNQAILTMVDSNVQRENILPSEKAFAYKMKLEAMKHQGIAYGQLGHKSRDKLSEDESGRTVQRYIRLTELIPELLKMVDNKQIAFSPAVELSFLKAEEQKLLLETIEAEQCTPSLSQAQRLKRFSQTDKLSQDTIFEILSEEKPNQKEQIRIKKERIQKYFPKSYSDTKMEETIIKLLADWQRKRQEINRDSR